MYTHTRVHTHAPQGLLSDPNMDPEFLGHLVMTAANKKAFKLTVQAIKDKYYELYRGKGGGGDEDFVAEAQAEPVDKGEAGPSVVPSAIIQVFMNSS